MKKMLKNKLKIAFVFDDSLDRPDGVQQYIFILSNYFQSLGHEVFFLVGQSSKRLKNSFSLAKNLRVKFNRNIMSIPIKADQKRIDEIMHQFDFDVMHFQLPFSPVLSHQIIKKNKGALLVGTFHLFSERKLEIISSKLLNLLIKNDLKKLDLVYSVSKPASDFAFLNFNLMTKIMPIPIDLDKFHQSIINKVNHDHQTKILFLGRLVKRKNCQLFLKSIKLLNEIHPEINFNAIVAGDGPLKQKLIKYSQDNQINHLVDFVGQVSENKKIKLLSSVDISVFPSIGSESFGIVLIESLASQHSIVLASRNQGYQSILKSLKTNLFEPKDPVDLANKIFEFINNHQLVTKTLKKQHELIRNFDLHLIGNQILNDYSNYLSNIRKS